MNRFVIALTVLMTLLFAAPVQAQQISGEGAGSYTSSEFYDRSIDDLNTRVELYLACARNGYIYDPDHPDADGNGCALIEQVGYEFRNNRAELRFETTVKGVWGPWVSIKGPTGPDGQATVCPGWQTGPWGACTAGGTRTRSVTCNSGGCCGPQPNDTESCTPPCTDWTWGGWAECSLGEQSRTATCGAANCCAEPSPNPQTRTCTVACTGSWIFNGWGACNNGTQQAQYYCSSTCCNGNAPTDTQPCGSTSTSSSGGTGTWELGNCNANPTWQTTDWGNCNVGCGATGSQTRTVSCANTQGQRPYTCSTSSGCSGSAPAPQSCTANCNVNTRPLDSQSCTGSCSGVPNFCECIMGGQYSVLFGRRQPQMTQWGYDCSHIRQCANGRDQWILCNHEGTMTCIRNNQSCTQGVHYECH